MTGRLELALLGVDAEDDQVVGGLVGGRQLLDSIRSKLKELDVTGNGLATLLTVQGDKRQYRLTDCQAILVRVGNAGVRYPSGVHSQEVVIVSDKHSFLPVGVIELLEVGSSD